MKKMFAAIVLSLMLALSACASVTEGTITDKSVSQEEITEQECEKETYYTGTGKNRKKQTRTECEEVGTGEFEDVFTFDLENEKGDTGTVEVDEDTYNEYEVGDYYKPE